MGQGSLVTQFGKIDAGPSANVGAFIDEESAALRGEVGQPL